MSAAYITARRSVPLAATFKHRNATSEIEYGFPVAPVGAKRRVLGRWHYRDGSCSDWAYITYVGAVTFEHFREWEQAFKIKPAS